MNESANRKSVESETVAVAPRARSFVKFAGGKTKLLPDLIARLPREFGNYFEPFIGGGALYWALQDVFAAKKRYTIGDTNDELITAYRVIKEQPEELIAILKSMKNTEAAFYRVRKADPTRMTDVQRAARTIYLNKTCFNGLYRVNAKGAFNVPFGKYEKPMICDVANLRACSAALAKTAIVTADFERVATKAKEGDLVFFDPPYYPVKKDSFVGYGADRFLPAIHERLRDCMIELRDRGVHVMLTNSDTPEVRKLWKGWKIKRVMVARAINSKADGRGKVGEVIVTP